MYEERVNRDLVAYSTCLQGDPESRVTIGQLWECGPWNVLYISD